jgi:hypothetical protein
LPRAGRKGRPPAVGLAAGPDGLRIRLAGEEVAVEYLHPGASETARLVVPLDALAACAGNAGACVLKPALNGHVAVAWAGGSAAPGKLFPAEGLEVPDFPAWPEANAANGPELLAALDRAAQVTSRDSGRLALQRIQLRGRKGDVVATDGRQLLIQGGFTFPWREDLLVAAAPVFGATELAGGAVRVARSAVHVLFRSGPWTVACKVADGDRYPHVDSVLPRPGAPRTAWRLGPGERALLVRTLPALPAGRDDPAPVTVDLGPPVVLRAEDERHHRPVEVPLPGSWVEGPPVRFSTDRRLLRTACRLGFEEVALTGADKPAVCRDGDRVYAWVLLAPPAARRHPVRVPPGGVAGRQAGSEPSPAAAAFRLGGGRPAGGAPAGGAQPAGWFPRLARWLRGVRRLAGLIADERRRERSA